MKIIKQGKLAEQWSLEHECTGWENGGEGCNAILEIERDDLYYYPGSSCSPWGETSPSVYFICPSCATKTAIGINDYPFQYHKLKQSKI